MIPLIYDRQVYGLKEEGMNAVLKSKILLVGFNPVCCEILKNFIRLGFQTISIVCFGSSSITVQGQMKLFLHQSKYSSFEEWKTELVTRAKGMNSQLLIEVVQLPSVDAFDWKSYSNECQSVIITDEFELPIAKLNTMSEYFLQKSVQFCSIGLLETIGRILLCGNNRGVLYEEFLLHPKYSAMEVNLDSNKSKINQLISAARENNEKGIYFVPIVSLICALACHLNLNWISFPSDFTPFTSYTLDYQEIQRTTRQTLNLFVVGAGAIGCELVKNLALYFEEQQLHVCIHVADFDAIEDSNLSRQFFYTSQHLHQSKCEVLIQEAQKLAPQFVTLIGYPIKVDEQSEKSQLTTPFWDKLDIVFAAVDNVKARNYLDYKCQLHNLVFVDAGIENNRGNVNVYLPGAVTRYRDESNMQEATVKIASCTIKEFPENSSHTIAWAKQKYEQLFEKAQWLQMKKKTAIDERSIAKELFEELFETTIQEMDLKKEYWETREKPKPICFDSSHVLCREFETYTINLLQKMVPTQGNDTQIVPFEKDDPNCIHWIRIAALLRNENFSISTTANEMNFYTVKQMVGDIIPSFITLASCVASVQCLEMLKLVEEQYDQSNDFVCNWGAKITRQTKLKCKSILEELKTISMKLSRNATIAQLIEKLPVAVESVYREQIAVYDKNIDSEERLQSLITDCLCVDQQKCANTEVVLTIIHEASLNSSFIRLTLE